MTSAAAKLELQGLPDLLQWVDFGTCAVIFLPSCRWLIPLIGQINAPSSASLQVVLTEPCADTVLECAPKYPLNNPKLQSAELVTMRPSAKPPFKRFADAFPFLSKDAGLVIFAGGMEAFDRLSSAQLNALLVNLANDASDGAKAVLLCLGGLSAELKQHILNSRRAVSCAAAIEKQGDHFVWITNFWHAMDHYCDEVTLPLSFDADGRLLIDSETIVVPALNAAMRTLFGVPFRHCRLNLQESPIFEPLRTIRPFSQPVCVRLPPHWFSGLTVPKTLNLSDARFLRCGGAAEDCSKLPPWKQRRRSEPLRLLSCLAAEPILFLKIQPLAVISASCLPP